MQVSEMIRDLDSQIEKLQRARKSLAEVEDSGAQEPTRKTRNQSAKKASKQKIPANVLSTKRKMSEAGRKKIAEAMRKRWADKRKSGVTTVKLVK